MKAAQTQTVLSLRSPVVGLVAAVSVGVMVLVGAGCGTMPQPFDPPAPTPPTPPVAGPVANAGAEVAVSEGEAVTLDGSASTGEGLAHLWRQIDGPAVAKASVYEASRVELTAPEVTADTFLVFELTVTDAQGRSDTATARVNIANIPAPISDAGKNQSVAAGAMVTLDGSGSTGKGLTFAWTEETTTAVAISKADEARATFTAADVSDEQVLTFRLDVTDARGQQSSDSVSITVQPANHAPVAEPISIATDMSVPVVELQLIARDADNDAVRFLLVGSADGEGYTDAFVDAVTGQFQATLIDAAAERIVIAYQATDGSLFSQPADITIEIKSVETGGLGAIEEDPETYASYAESDMGGELLGGPGDLPTAPASVDLSANFPTPGNQGRQGSCTAWATAYACKSYHERREIGWALNTPAHLFSPAYVYNQINNGRDAGSAISTALNLAVNQGIATLALAPYNDGDYRTQPSSTARTEAAKFKARTWNRVSGTANIKAALANGVPVIAHVTVYDSFNSISGTNAVYSRLSGNKLGGHAVCIVGYDNSRFGGAFKIINSWGTNWGDRGFFWLPYSMVPQAMVEAYVLFDAENSGVQPPSPTPPPSGDLPNVSITAWKAEYDARPGGAGTLQWRIANTGIGALRSGTKVSLMLSSNDTISSSDTYVMYERISFDLASGRAAYRDESNAIRFTFPANLVPGTYKMALWVDDEQAVRESNENDNISLGSTPVVIRNTKPDLSVRRWWASWASDGAGQLEFTVANDGASTINLTTWNVTLVLSPDEAIGNGNDYVVFSENAGHVLAPGIAVQRTSTSRARFNITQTASGAAIPSGTYYVALWADNQRQVDESNEGNNASLGQNRVTITRGTRSTELVEDFGPGSQQGFNGLSMPTPEELVEMQAAGDKAGTRSNEIGDGETIPAATPVEEIATQTTESAEFAVFPTKEAFAMP